MTVSFFLNAKYSGRYPNDHSRRGSSNEEGFVAVNNMLNALARAATPYIPNFWQLLPLVGLWYRSIIVLLLQQLKNEISKCQFVTPKVVAPFLN
jgi:hypothetical protein